MLSAGTPVSIEGCVDGWSWCDVATPDGRGWVAGDFLQEEYQGRRVLVPEYGVQIGIPFVTFEFGSYWDNNYRNRSWYGERERYSKVRPQYRPIVVHTDSHASHTSGHDQARPSNAAAPQRPVTESRPPEKAVAQRHPATTQTRTPETAVAQQHPATTEARMPEKTVAQPRPVTEARQPEKEAVRAKPVVAKAATPKPAAPKAQPKPQTERDEGKDKEKDQH